MRSSSAQLTDHELLEIKLGCPEMQQLPIRKREVEGDFHELISRVGVVKGSTW